jgi:hypothetical protein
MPFETERDAGRAAMPEPEIGQEAARAMLAALRQTRAMFEQIMDAVGADPEETFLRVTARNKDTGATREVERLSVQQCFDNADAANALGERGA